MTAFHSILPQDNGHNGRRFRLHRSTLRAGVAVAAVCLFAGTLSAAQAGAQAADSAYVPVQSSGVVPLGAKVLGPLPGNKALHLAIVLKPRDPRALKAFAETVSNPKSPLFRHYVPRGRFGEAFGASSEVVAGVTRALHDRGLRPGSIDISHLEIPITASAAAVSRAFSVRLAEYRLESGRVAYTNTTAAVLPAGVGSSIQAILGLTNVYRELPLRTTSRIPTGAARHSKRYLAATTGPQPCSAAQSQASVDGSFTADQLAAMYDMEPIYGANDFGGGQTVAALELEPYSPADVSAYQACYGTNASVAPITVDGGAGSGVGSGEAALDIEDIVGLAPRSRVLAYEAPNTNAGFYDAFSAIMAQDIAKIVSVSWGQCEQYTPSGFMGALNTVFQQAAAQGQTVLASAGDTGSEDCSQANAGDTRLSVDDPASQPFVTGVGGTTVEDSGSPPTEVVWNEAFFGGGAGGGGVSSVWPAPSYQSRYVGGSAHRMVPDVSADADPSTGYVVFYDGQWMSIGGTSAAAPLWAALIALTNARCRTAIGFANPALYYAFSAQDPVHVGYDIVADPNNFNPNDNDYLQVNNGQYPTQTGFDMATGLGTPDGASLAAQLCAQTSPSPTTVPGDFLGTGSSDIGVFRPSNGTWYVRGLSATVYGRSGDIPVPADYNADGRSDIAVFRPSTGTWYLRGLPSVQYGATGDVPVPGDYDGRVDMGVFRPSTGAWYIHGVQKLTWGRFGDIPVPADFNDDGRADVAVYRPSNGTWYIRGVGTISWGRSGDIPVQGDFNADGRADVAVYRPSNGTWYIRGISTIAWGRSGDIPLRGDFNGDGRRDVTVFRPSNGYWYTRGVSAVPYGRTGDVPLEK